MRPTQKVKFLYLVCIIIVCLLAILIYLSISAEKYNLYKPPIFNIVLNHLSTFLALVIVGIISVIIIRFTPIGYGIISHMEWKEKERLKEKILGTEGVEEKLKLLRKGNSHYYREIIFDRIKEVGWERRRRKNLFVNGEVLEIITSQEKYRVRKKILKKLSLFVKMDEVPKTKVWKKPIIYVVFSTAEKEDRKGLKNIKIIAGEELIKELFEKGKI